MQRITFVLLIAGSLAAGSVSADTYDYEVSLDFSSFDSDSISFPIIGGVPDPTQGSSETSSSDDDISISGSWFYTGLSDDEGPRSRAAFVSRASSVSLSYSRVDGDTSFSSNFFGFPVTGSGEQTVDALGLDWRHVWKDSGWYMLAGIAEAQADISITDPGGGTTEASASSDAYFLGFGKYLGSTTALDLIIGNAKSNGSNNVNVAVELSHIGDLNENWQYGADVGVIFADDENRAYNVQFSLYPNRDLAFGMGYTRTEDDDFFSSESSSLSGFASWFLSETTVVRAGFSSGDGEALGSELDTDGFSIGIRTRF